MIEYDFEIKYRIDNINFANESSKRFDYKNEKNENICLSTLQNKLKNVIIVALNIVFVITKNFILKQIKREKIDEFMFKIVEIKNNDKKKIY